MLPDTIPIFPLPNVVLFPHVFLPLHIFEPRYRAMVGDAIDGDRIIGMTLLKPGWETDNEQRPDVYPVGCAGLITHAERTGDGRFNIVLRGLEKFRVVGEDGSKPYRLAQIEPIAEPPGAALPDVRSERRRLEHLILASSHGGEAAPAAAITPPSMPDEDFINALAQYLQFDPLEKQALLEQPDALARCRSVIDLLEMKNLAGQREWIRE
ncbi:MAG: LON peptidase substrate-binding domain-containing protein [Acidobacteriota bacterium]|nr:LON peptidase substrate-binding domain-containing protein [Acidobacteriota bacterium]